MIKRAITISLIGFILIGCTSKEVVPPPAQKLEKERNIAELNQKYKLIKKNLEGTYLSTQRREASKEIGSILYDAKHYKRDLAHFEKTHPYKIKRKKRVRVIRKPCKETNNTKGNNEKSRLKFY